MRFSTVADRGIPRTGKGEPERGFAGAGHGTHGRFMSTLSDELQASVAVNICCHKAMPKSNFKRMRNTMKAYQSTRLCEEAKQLRQRLRFDRNSRCSPQRDVEMLR